MIAKEPVPGHSHPDTLRFAVRVTPRGGRDAIEGWDVDAGGRRLLKVRLRVAAEAGKANTALVDLLAKTLDVPRSAVAISSGLKARIKIVAVTGDRDVLSRRLQACGEGV